MPKIILPDNFCARYRYATIRIAVNEHMTHFVSQSFNLYDRKNGCARKVFAMSRRKCVRVANFLAGR